MINVLNIKGQKGRNSELVSLSFSKCSVETEAYKK